MSTEFDEAWEWFEWGVTSIITAKTPSGNNVLSDKLGILQRIVGSISDPADQIRIVDDFAAIMFMCVDKYTDDFAEATRRGRELGLAGQGRNKLKEGDKAVPLIDKYGRAALLQLKGQKKPHGASAIAKLSIKSVNAELKQVDKPPIKIGALIKRVERRLKSGAWREG